MSAPDLINKAEAAELLSISVSTVERLIAAGKLRAFRVGPHALRLDREDVLRYIRSSELRPPAAGRIARIIGPKDLRRGGVNNSGYYPGMKVVDPHE